MKADRLAGLGLAVLVLAAIPRPAHALLCGTFLDPMTVTTTGLAFGSYNPNSVTPKDASATITITCGLPIDLLPSFTVAISAGGAGAFAPRQMSFGSNTLNYNIFSDAARTTVWGDGTAGTVAPGYSSLLALGANSFTAYGRIPSGQFVKAGPYADTLIVTVTY